MFILEQVRKCPSDETTYVVPFCVGDSRWVYAIGTSTSLYSAIE